MKFSSPFILLLGSIFSLSLEANAIPLNPRQKGIVTLSLKRIPTRQDLHPQLLLQQHINRSHRRLARMTGREEPSAEVLSERLVSREAHIRRSSLRVGHSGAALAKQPSTSSTTSGFSQIDLKAEEDDSVALGKQPTAQNSSPLNIESNDVGYFMSVQIGNPPRNFAVTVDSGSADFWVTADGCQSSTVKGAGCGNHTSLGPQSSTSFVDTNQPFQVTYGSGQVSGNKINDDVTVAGLLLSGHAFGTASEETHQFTDSIPDGLMGLAQSSLSNQGVPTPVESLASAGIIQEAITSYKISRVSDSLNDGEVTFGGKDTSKFDPKTLVTLPNVNPQGFWEAQMDAVTVNGQDLGFNNRTAILDTGTTLLVVPPSDAEAIHRAIPGAKSDGNGGFTIPCTTNASLALSFGGQLFTIEPSDLTFVPSNSKDLTGDCVSGISSGQVQGPNEWLNGDVFLKNAYFSTDVGKNTIQLAKLI